VLECKQTGLTLDTGGWDKAMLRAHGQAVHPAPARGPPALRGGGRCGAQHRTLQLESAGHPPQVTAAFLIRCLFTLFAEDIGLLPHQGFTDLLRSVRANPAQFVPLTEHLWRDMNEGAAFSVILRARVPRFNGGLFAQGQALPLDRDQLDLLIDAGKADWRQVEPAIFGTLLERALDPRERHQLGAHYTPRSYVERLVLPTVINPLPASGPVSSTGWWPSAPARARGRTWTWSAARG